MSLSDLPVLIVGARGMLAADVIPLLIREGAEIRLSDRASGEIGGILVQSCDLASALEVTSLLDTVRPKVIFNLAAYTAVDAAEKEYKAAFAVNGMAPALLAKWAATNGAKLVHISTDYVFGGDERAAERKQPLAEDHPTNPCGIYGESKRMGEELVRSILPHASLIVRTSWLHGVHGPNFVDTIRRVSRERAKAGDKNPLRVVDDQIGSPTWATWLAETLVELVKLEASGTFHASARGNISWFDFAKEIVALEAPGVAVDRQSSSELSRPAPRPAYSTLAVAKLEALLGKPCPDWQHGLKEHLRVRKELEDGAHE